MLKKWNMFFWKMNKYLFSILAHMQISSLTFNLFNLSNDFFYYNLDQIGFNAMLEEKEV